MNDNSINRRDFLKGAAAAATFFLTAEGLLRAEETASSAIANVAGPPVKFGVIGLGQWGKEILTTLSKIPAAQVTGICDTYEPFVNKGKEIAPNAVTFTDYKQLLASADIEAVVIATPSHQHKEIVLAAIQAGKHVYCEAPIATTVEDAKAIAVAGQSSPKVFQVGLQGRSNLLYQHVQRFMKAGAVGSTAHVFGHWNKKESMRRVAPTPEREQELNWRLSSKTSSGLVGEIGIHQIDLANWYLNSLPVSVTGFGSIINWKDGRDTADTVQCILEYPNGIRMVWKATLCSSFSSSFTLFEGTNSTLIMREKRGWMVKEADAPLLGWEVYAAKSPCFDETGVCMIAEASKLLKAGEEPSKAGPELKTEPLQSALENFILNIKKDPNAPKIPGPLEGYQAAVTVIKANEAVISGTKVAYGNAFQLG